MGLELHHIVPPLGKAKTCIKKEQTTASDELNLAYILMGAYIIAITSCQLSTKLNIRE